MFAGITDVLVWFVFSFVWMYFILYLLSLYRMQQGHCVYVPQVYLHTLHLYIYKIQKKSSPTSNVKQNICSIACPQNPLNHVLTSDGFWQQSSVFWIGQIVSLRELMTLRCCHNARWSPVGLLWPQPLFPFSSRPHHPITFNYWGESAHSTLATGSVNGIVGSPVGDGELASNRADMCGSWMTSSGARREPLSVRSSSRAELAFWSTNQFGEEGKINTGSPTWSQEGI